VQKAQADLCVQDILLAKSEAQIVYDVTGALAQFQSTRRRSASPARAALRASPASMRGCTSMATTRPAGPTRRASSRVKNSMPGPGPAREGRPQRALPVWQREEVQEVRWVCPRGARCRSSSASLPPCLSLQVRLFEHFEFQDQDPLSSRRK